MRHLRQSIKQRKPFESLEQEVFLEVLRTGNALVQDLVDLLRPYGLTQPQYNVLRILRGRGATGLPTGEVGERMVVSREPDCHPAAHQDGAAGLVRARAAVRQPALCDRTDHPQGLGVLEGA